MLATSLIAIATFSSTAQASDVVVMRRVIALPNQVVAPPPSGGTASWRYQEGTWSSNCSRAATRTNLVSCQRSGVAVGEDQCDAGLKPTAVETSERYSGCTYEPRYGEAGACTPDGPGARTGTSVAEISGCLRSDGETVGKAYCGPETRETVCTPPEPSSRYAREASSLLDPYDQSQQSQAYRNVNVAGASTLVLTAAQTLCWDSESDAAVPQSSCSTLTTGVQPYDAVTLPAVQVQGLREIYLDRADVARAMPHGNVLLGDSVEASCSGARTVRIGNDNWKVLCGAADSASNYVREVGVLKIAGTNLNKSSDPRMFFTVASTFCHNVATDQPATSAKCNFLAEGANIGDVASVPATYITDLREVYVDRTNIVAAMGRSSTIQSATSATTAYGIDTFCNGTLKTGIATPSGVQSWTIKCGSADSADKYVREPNTIEVPYSLASNVTTSNVFNFTVKKTQCWDITLQAAASDSKCANLVNGANLNDLVGVPATFVPELAEIYVEQADLTAALGRGYAYTQSTLSAYSPATLCTAGLTSSVFTPASVGFRLLCGTPDNPASYVREVGKLELSTGVNVNRSSDTRLKFSASTTSCWNRTLQATATPRKCAYLRSGVNVGDVVSIDVSYQPELLELYISQADLAAAVGRINNLDVGVGYTSSSFCGGSVKIGIIDGSVSKSYFVKCNAPDDPAKYSREVRNLEFFSNSTNNISRSVYSFNVSNTECWDNSVTPNIKAAASKCENLSRGVKQNDKIDLPVVYVADLQEMYFVQADLTNALGRGTSFTTGTTNLSPPAVCTYAGAITIYASNVAKSYRAKCGTPDSAANYARYATVLDDPYYNYPTDTSAFRNVNNTASNALVMNIGAVGCRQKEAGTDAVAIKCQYMSGTPLNSRISIPAAWNVFAKTVSVAYSAIEAASPYSSRTQINSAACGKKWYVTGTGSGLYTVTCS